MFRHPEVQSVVLVMKTVQRTEIPLKRSFYHLGSFGDRKEACLDNCLKQDKSIVILGEPGMGKTFVLRQILERSDQYIWVPPDSLTRNPDRFRPKTSNQYLVIDGIDELPALEDTDVLHSVLKALAKIDYPKFILSCRSAEWKHVSSSHEIENDYGEPPEILTLLGITREEATDYLSQSCLNLDANATLEHLDNVNLPEIYKNPLYLRLVAEVLGKRHSDSVTSKYDFFERVCKILLSEQNPSQLPKSSLGKLAKDSAFNAAGAICASLLITGRNFVTTNHPIDKRDGSLTLDVSEIEGLPKAEQARLVVASPFFRVVDDSAGCLVPYHRTLAEFLAAHWIASSLGKRELTRNRFLQSIMVEAMFPSSLRGLCGWLALDDRFTDKILATDPYGILIYSDLQRLSSHAICKLINELVVLSHKSPSFRSEDWSEYVPMGLVRRDTAQTIENLIVDENIGTQLKQLLVEAIKASDLVSVFENSLTRILCSRKESYTVRLHVLEILLDVSKNTELWTKIIRRLRKHNCSDSTEFCIFILDDVGVKNFPLPLVSECVLADTGFIRDRDRSGMLRTSSVLRLANHFDVDYSSNFLDLISSGIRRFLASRDNNDRYNPSWACISSFCYPIVERLYRAKSLEYCKLVYWTATISPFGFLNNSWRNGIDSILTEDERFRRGVQSYLINNPGKLKHLELFLFRFGEISDKLNLTFDDICFHIEQFCERPKLSKKELSIWTALLKSRIYSLDEINQIETLSQSLLEQYKDLSKILTEQRKRSLTSDLTWVEKNTAKRDESNARLLKRRSARRKLIQDEIEAFENGDITEVIFCAKDYLGINRYESYYVNPRERVTQEIGTDLLDSALKGFRSILYKSDLPTSTQVADSYSRKKSSPYVYPILATLTEYLDQSSTFEGLSDEILLVGFYTLRHEPLIDQSIQRKLYRTLEKEVFRRFEDDVVYQRWIEPQIKNDSFAYSDFVSLTNHYRNPAVILPMVMDWLQSYDTISTNDTKKLVSDLLFPQKHFASLNKERLLKIAFDSIGNDNSDLALFWASVIFCLDLNFFLNHVPSRLKTHADLIWHIRDTATKHLPTDQDCLQTVDLDLSGEQLHWIISNFRRKWNYIEFWPGALAGNNNPWDASEYLQSCIKRLGTMVDELAHDRLDVLVKEESDGYMEHLRTAQSNQKRARIQHKFRAPSLKSLKTLLEDGEPRSPKDLQTMFLASLDELQRRLRGDPVETVKRFYKDSGIPRVENDCRDLLVSLLDKHYDLRLIPEFVTPHNTRADIGVIFKEFTVPVEVKPQWNGDLWNGLKTQLARNYTKEYSSSGYGVYLVLWFGRKTCKGRYLKHPPSNQFFPTFLQGPTTPNELSFMLTNLIPEGSKDLIRVYVLDLETSHE